MRPPAWPASRSTTLMIALGLALLGAGPAAAQDVISVSVQPVGTDEGDPNQGGWFVLEVDPGGTGTAQAAITNPADVSQSVVLEVRDLDFGDDGAGNIPEREDRGLGAWGAFEEREIQLPAGETHIASFHVRVPSDAEPGDHIGAVVATTTNLQDGAQVRRRIATRLYVTVPGEAVRSLVIEGVEVAYDSKWWPSMAAVTVLLENDGRVRLRPTVTVAGDQAQGPELLLSRSTEQYIASQTVRWFGGLLRLPVQATADGGLARAVNTSHVVVPWGLLVALILLLGAGAGLWRWQSQRTGSTQELRADIQRLERLVTQQAGVGTAAVTTLGEDEGSAVDEDAILAAAIQRARRTNDHVGLGRAALTVHATTGEALDLLLEAFAADEGRHREALLAAISTYDPEAVTGHPRLALLSDEDSAIVRKRVAPTKKPGAKKSTKKKAAPKKPKKDE